MLSVPSQQPQPPPVPPPPFAVLSRTPHSSADPLLKHRESAAQARSSLEGYVVKNVPLESMESGRQVRRLFSDVLEGAKRVFRYNDADKSNPTLMNFIQFRKLNKEVAIDPLTGKEYGNSCKWGHASALGTSLWPKVPPQNAGSEWWGILPDARTIDYGVARNLDDV